MTKIKRPAPTPASMPKTRFGPPESDQGTWKYGMAGRGNGRISLGWSAGLERDLFDLPKPPMVRAKLIMADTSPCC